MEIEQLQQRLEWLDGERRKDKSRVTVLENRIQQLEENLAAARKEAAGLQDNLSQVKLLHGKVGQVENQLSKIKLGQAKLEEGTADIQATLQGGLLRTAAAEAEETQKSIRELRKGVQGSAELKKSLKELETDLTLTKNQIVKLNDQLLQNKAAFDQFQQSQKLQEETRRVDNKRITEVQGETAAYRKRMDEVRAKVDLTAENLRNAEARLEALQAADAERRTGQMAFMEKFNQQQVERDRTWRDWQEEIARVLQGSAKVAEQFQNLEETILNVRRTREQLDDATQKVERRVNEITEMYRLNEEHFKQEWNAFKTDDQKRWTNYSLLLDEQQKDAQRQSERMEKRVSQLEELGRRLDELFGSLQAEEEKRLRQLVAFMHEWLAATERLLGKPSDLI